MIKDIVKESKDFADSEDVKDIINKYKADQNKDASKMKKMITDLYQTASLREVCWISEVRIFL